MPSKVYVPSYKDILDLANANIDAYLLSIDVRIKIKIEANLQDIKTHKLMDISARDSITQNEENYVWFYVPNIAGGTDCYYHKNLPIEKEVWEDELETNLNAQKNKEIIKKSIEIGHQWIFRRSAGQSAIVTLSYGMLAASLAKLTDGIIYSDDGAWDYSIFPTTPEEFLLCYFRPEYSTDKTIKAFTKQCIVQLKNNMPSPL